MARTNPKKPLPGPFTLDNDATCVKMIAECRHEAEMAKTTRMLQNKMNWNAYYGNQDFSHKQEGQSQEILPKVGEAVEQFAAFSEKALTQFGDWFSSTVPEGSPIDADQMRRLLECYLEKIQVSMNKTLPFASILSMAIKSGLLESLMVLKVHGRKIKQTVYTTKKGSDQPVPSVRYVWRPCIDLVPNGDYFPDPTGRGLYEIHRVERDLVDVRAMAESGIYDKEAVNAIVEDFARNDVNKMLAVQRNQNETFSPSFRKRVVIDEYHGTLLNPDGTVYMESALCAVANEKYVVRKPEKNPAWHGKSPFVVIPLVQIPFTVWGKALYDHAVSLNVALNELFNLMLDGGIAQVWGIRQVRTNWLENPEEVSNGIPQGATLAVNEQCPIDGKVVERTDSLGQVPQEALAMYNLADREFQAASMVNDIRMGSLPQRQVKATEVVESSNNSAVLLDSFSSKIERGGIQPILEMTWMNLLQNMDSLEGNEVADALGQDNALRLANMTPAQRHAMFGNGYGFKVFGMSATMSRARDFQKLMALQQSLGTNPMLMQAFMKKYSPDRIITFIMKALNISPKELENTPEEQQQVDQNLQQMQQMTQITGGGQQASPTGGQESVNGQIQQNVAPSGGPGA